MEEHRKLRQIIRSRPNGLRTRGRSRKTYMNAIKETARKKIGDMTELRKTACDRKDRRWIGAVSTL